MNNENRETTTFKAGEHEVVAHTYATGFDMRKISNSAFEQLEVIAKNQGKDIGEVKITTGTMLSVKEDAKIRAIIVSVDGKSDDVLSSVLSMRAEDYDVVMAYVNKLTEKPTDPKAQAGTEKNSQNTPAQTA